MRQESNSKSQELTVANSKVLDAEAYHVILGQVPEPDIVRVAMGANAVHFYSPPTWDSYTLREWTERVVSDIQARGKTVHNAPVRNNSVYLELMDSRKSQDPCVWVAGCSFAYGMGLESQDDRYAIKVAQALNMPLCDLSSPASSIEWAADQLLRSDVRANDVVLWGLTGVHRISYYLNGRVVHLTPTMVDFCECPKDQKEYLIKLVTDDSRLSDAVKKVLQVANVFDKMGVKLLIFTHELLNTADCAKVMLEHIHTLPSFLKISPINDRAPHSTSHPGPKSNQIWSSEILTALGRFKDER